MGVAYQIDAELGTTYTLYDGIITAEESLANVEQILADPNWPPHRKLHLSDVTTMTPDPTLPDLTIEQMERLWKEQMTMLKGFKIAIVATGTFSQATKLRPAVSPYGQSLIVFNSLATACVWLDVDFEKSAGILAGLRAGLRRSP